MAIAKTSPKPFLGAQIPNVKVLSSKIDEIIDAVNDLTDGTITTTDLTVSDDLTVGGDTTLDGVLLQSLTTDSTSKDTGAVILEGGIGIEKNASVGVDLNLGANIVLAKEVNHTISTDASTTAAALGGSINIKGGVGKTSGPGGAAFLQGGAADTTGAGGQVAITSGTGGSTSGNSGGVFLRSAAVSTASSSGVLTLASGTTVSANSGAASLSSGVVSTSGNSGTSTVQSGNSTTTGNSGLVTVKSGTVGTGDSGNVALTSGNSSVGGTGDITLTTGDTASGLAGDIILIPGAHTSVTVQPVISLNKGVVKKPESTSVASGGTITGPQLVAGLITATGATGSWNLPTAAQITTAIGSTPAGTNFEFVFIANGMTAGNIATLVVGANMVALKQTSSGDSATDQLLTITNTSNVNVGVFKVVFDTATSCVLSRIS